MIRAWLGIALVASSWLFGLGFYHDPNWLAWAAMILAGTLLLAGTVRLPGRVEVGVATALFLPGVWLAPWPYRAAPLLIVAGAILYLLPIPRRWPKSLGSAGIIAGTLLLVQSLAMLAYESATARSHELPWPLPSLLGGVVRLLGIDAAVDGSTLAVYSVRKTHRLGATWELLLDPTSLLFFAAAAVFVLVCVWANRPRGDRAGAGLRALGALAAVAAVWLPFRVGLLVAVYLHRVLRTDYDAPIAAMSQFWNPWLLAAFLAAPVLLAWRFVRLPREEAAGAVAPQASVPKWKYAAAGGLVFAAAAVLNAAVFWDPAGDRKPGRVLVDEFHTTWEPTQKPFDTKWYGHMSTYTYAAIYDYCSRFYQMGRLTKQITDAALADCDVLVVKIPTTRYTPAEVDAIGRFVERGGGLMLIGDHTNVFRSGTYLNDIAQKFGFAYRYDSLFGIDSVFEEQFDPLLVPHPVVQYMPRMDFEGPCSIDPQGSTGRAVILGTGQKNLPADYHVSNYYPQPEDRPEMRYGAFVELWGTRDGKGRVLAFTDSTVFSNFSTFEPGKPELMLGMLEWLNHSNGPFEPRIALAVLGALLLAAGLFVGRGWDGGWLPLAALGMLGWAVAVLGVRAAHREAMPPVEPQRPMVRVSIDRTVCGTTLSKGGFIAGETSGFGIFDQWILRLGYFTSRTQGAAGFAGDALIFYYPTQTPSEEFRAGLVDYVAKGGKVLVIDSPENQNSTANSLLFPFKLSVNRTSIEKGELVAPAGWPAVPIESAAAVSGGTPWARVGDKPVAATVRYQKGSVTVVGFGSRFTDANMGVTADVEPDEKLRQVFELEYAILRAIVGGQRVELPGKPAAKPSP
ncbi:MAG: DUF4350 domain-containing protein [Pirellulales bacterium]